MSIERLVSLEKLMKCVQSLATALSPKQFDVDIVADAVAELTKAGYAPAGIVSTTCFDKMIDIICAELTQRMLSDHDIMFFVALVSHITPEQRGAVGSNGCTFCDSPLDVIDTCGYPGMIATHTSQQVIHHATTRSIEKLMLKLMSTHRHPHISCFVVVVDLVLWSVISAVETKFV